jgi:hypothetical protein
MPQDLLEPELADVYKAWKTTPSPDSNAAMLTALTPHIDRAVRMHLGQAASGPLILSRARQMALKALPRYDSSKAKLGTFLVNDLKGLKRVQRQQNQLVRAPERLLLDRAALQRHEQELHDELGRDPSDAELADWSGFSVKRISQVRAFRPAIASGTLESAGVMPGVERTTPLSDTWTQIVYNDLGSTDQRILEHTLGLHGRSKLSNQEIAAKLGLSPGAISQRKAKIQKLLDEEQGISPLL